MKTKGILLLIFLLCFIGRNQAQTHVGLKVGVNYVNNVAVNLPTYLDYESKYRLAFHIGVITKVELKKNFSLNFELILSDKGSNYVRMINAIQNENVNLHLLYLNLPLLVSYNILDKLNLEIGPEIGYLISARAKSSSIDVDLKSTYDNNFDFGLATGMNYEFLDHWKIGVRYTHGFSSVIKTPDNYWKFQNRTLQLSIVYMIN
jgi:hypothetical protein